MSPMGALSGVSEAVFGYTVLNVQTWFLQKIVYNGPKDTLLDGNVNNFIRSIDKILTGKPL